MFTLRTNIDYHKAQMFHKSGHDVIANLYLRAAYGIKS